MTLNAMTTIARPDATAPTPRGASAPRSLPTTLPLDALTAETPLFAADARYARHRGGPLTRAFVDALPPAWSLDRVVVDSTLVWLRRGMVPNGFGAFHREPYPEDSHGAYAAANAELDTHHVACFFGPSHAEVLRGHVGLDELPPVSPTRGRADLSRRHAALVALLDAGQLSLEPMPAGQPFAYDARTFLRYAPARESGFHLWLRATHGSQRPIVNGHRNVSNL
ncbi:MAG: hypothetical protein KC583_03655 [Myxococcales bacterium]|nr:hypothetical protein [Myxococcales bacterium]